MLTLKFIIQQNLSTHGQSVGVRLLTIIICNHISRRLRDPTRRSVMPSHFDLRFFIRTIVIDFYLLRIRPNIRIRIINQSCRMALLSIRLDPIIIIDLFPHLILCRLLLDSLDGLTLVDLSFILQLALTGDVVVLSKLGLWIVVLLPVQLCRRSAFVGDIVLNLG